MRRGRKASGRGGGVSKGPGAGRQAAQVNGGCMKLGSSDQLTGCVLTSLLPFVPSVGGQVQ